MSLPLGRSGGSVERNGVVDREVQVIVFRDARQLGASLF
jgi:hypothetical protein